ncbi:two-component system sensor histidine kinase NtrB [Delftia sp. PS-11]|uniref:two-component system sensor histidine kinase NtrB n=1 Tax=Delftia sp. PS-11 TaxID=2767222 RepID=UPI0024630EE4|nr:histidine kinase [Delftia sp. PS-11]
MNEQLQARYLQLVEQAFLSGNAVERESALNAVAQLGRSLLPTQVTPVDIVSLHQTALERIAQQQPDWHISEIAGHILVPLLELTSAHSMAYQEMVQAKHDATLAAHREQASRLEALGVLAAGMAHDFNTLLGSISGYAELSHGEMPHGGAGHEYLHQIEVACQRAQSLIRRMLDFAGQRSGPPSRQLLALQVGEALELLHPKLGSRFRLQWSNLMPDAQVIAEEGQIQQIVLNLCINALDAMPHGGLLQVRLQPAAQLAHIPAGHESHAALVVADSGCGMPPEVQARVFEPFFTTKAPQGSGLGLSVVYGIVRRLGGEIILHSQSSGPQTGTTFTVFLPTEAHQTEGG